MRRFLTTLVLMAGFASPARAEPLDRREIAADARWVVHVDFDAARSATVARKVLDGWLARESVQRGLEQIEAAVGTDLEEDLHSASLYGSRFAPQTGVVIVRAEVDGQRVREFVGKLPDFRAGLHGGHELYTWTQDKGKSNERPVTGCVVGSGIIVFGQNADDVKKALDVLDGKLPRLAGSGSLLDRDAPAGTIVQAGAVRLAEAELPFQSPIVQQCQLLAMAAGEQDGVVFVRGESTMKSDEVADQVKTIVEGFIAIAKLQYSDEEELVEILRAVTVTKAEKTVRVEWRGSAEKVLKLVEKAWAKQLQQKQDD
ncbi:MAG TPA: hypothetical protein VMY42_23525 [Thermoguttaceae bacterium]|nr:hypothetical protein [Thermoguttaceae bacterium]